MKQLWMETWFVTILAMLVFVGLFSCGKGSSDTTLNTSVIPSSPCGTGLADIDLSGTCRHNPPTIGALETI